MQMKSETRNSLKSLKFSNRKIVLRFMRYAGALSVNQISNGTGLSKMTVHKIIDHYRDDGIVIDAGKGDSTEEGGKKPNLFSLNPNCRYIFALRIARDFISTSIVNLKGEPIAQTRSVPVEHHSFGVVMRKAGEIFRERVAESKLPLDECQAAVVACEGVVDPDRGVVVTSYQYPRWDADTNVRDGLRAVLPVDIPVYVDSLWRHLAQTELFLAHKERAEPPEGWDRRNNFFLIGNSGDFVSGGMVCGGKAIRGASGFAGEIGHMIVDPRSSERCHCGGFGCLEVLVVPGKVLEHAKAHFSEYPDSTIFGGSATGEVGCFCDIGEAADGGDELAQKLMDDSVEHFAVAINNILIVCDPGRIIFFGDYARCGEYFIQQLRKRVESLTMRGIAKNTVIDASTLEEEYGVIGAASRIADALFED